MRPIACSDLIWEVQRERGRERERERALANGVGILGQGRKEGREEGSR